MPGLGLLFLVVCLAAFGSRLFIDISLPAFAHAAFAAAALPLMLGAMLHFVPVLTRSAAPSRFMTLLPWAAGAGGAVAMAGVAGWLPPTALWLAALLVASALVVMLGWVTRRIRTCLGAPHPGVLWYLAALGFLLVGMAAVVGMLADPARFSAWRALHLHVNLFGWIGLTALGTLPVLLPTHLRQFDPDAAGRLKRLLWPACFGVVLLAVGTALASGWLAAAGAAVFATAPGLHLFAWLRRYGFETLRRGIAASLSLATAGLVVLLAAGLAHGFVHASGEPMVGGFVFAFLFPLVLGALAQLLPVWCFPGPETAARVVLHAALARHAALRALACLLAALLHLIGSVLAPAFAAAAVLHFSATLLFAWRGVRAARNLAHDKSPADPL